VNATPRVELRLEGDVLTVSDGSLDGERDRLFFGVLLGGERTAEGWRCPVRDRDGDELVLQVTRHLQGAGRQVNATSDRAQQALDRDLERQRSYDRALAAGRAWREQVEQAVTPDTTAVLATLREAGWDSVARDLRPHQLAGALHALSASNTANFSVPGAGKTATTLAVVATHLQEGTVDCAVVVGPLSAFAPWEKETQIAMPGRLRVRRVRGTPDARRAILEEVERGDVFLLTYPTAASDRAELERLCARMKVMLVVDESHRVKRFNGGLWAPALIEVARRSRVRMILSGTPMPQSALDLWSQFMILWPGGELTGPPARYRARARGNFDSLRTSLLPFFMRTPKEALGLPPYELERPPVQLAPIQAEIYAAIADDLRQIAAAPGPIQTRVETLRRARPIRLLQVASNPDLLNDEDGFYGLPALDEAPQALLDRLQSYRELGELPAKFTWGLDYLRGLRDQDPRQKCVVWTSFVRNIEQFAERIEADLDGRVFKIHGGVPAAEEGAPGDPDEDETREQLIAQFLAADGFAVLVANPAACAESISLHSHCHRALYLDRTYDCARWLQSIDRIHRLGLPEGVRVEIQVPLAELDGAGAIDGLVDQSLARKAQRMEALLAGADLVPEALADRDTLAAAQGNAEDLEEVLRYLLGEDVGAPAG
jgi:SNF2 family DNA or RNA helicase